MKRTSKPKYLSLLFFVLLLPVLACVHAYGASSISQFGITWTFDHDYQTGQFVNGDYWVVGPVKITSISPRSTNSGGVIMNGSMVNPAINGAQGYDSRIKYNTFSAALNVGACLPLTLQPGTSLLSSKSYTTAATGDNPQLDTIAILTVLNCPAPAGSFRPAPVGTDKTITWNKSQLNYSRLRSLAPVANTPSLSSVEALFARPWIEQGTTWVSRYMHPGGNQPTYGREISHTLAQGLLSLQLNYTNAQKEKLLVRLVQYGLDIYGSARLGAVWPAGGGHNHGRKMPMLLAGTVLGDADILALTDGEKMIFQEDRQTWYVGQSDVGRALYTADGRPRVPYIQSDVGVPEWGEKHYQEPKWDGRNWDSYYRVVVGASIPGHVLAARLMGLQEVWNWPALFDYVDRYVRVEGSQSSTGTNEIQPFVKSMWDAYRNVAPTTSTAPSTPTAPTNIWQNIPMGNQSSSFTVAFDMVASAANIDGVTGMSSGNAFAFDCLATGIRFSTSGYIDARNGSTYQAATSLKYTAGVKYRVVMTVNVATKRYSATVTPAGGATVTIANNWQFRTEQAGVTVLNNLGYCATSGSVSVSDSGIQSPTTTPTTPTTTPSTPTTSTPTTTTPAPAPTSSTTTVTLQKTSSASYTNVGLPKIACDATVSFDVTPNGDPIDAVTALTNGPADAYSDFAVAIRLSPSGRFEAINGNSWSCAATLNYDAGKTYQVFVTIDWSSHTYSVSVTPAGGTAVKIAKDWAFRTSQASVSQLTNITLFAAAGSHKVGKATVTNQ